MLVIVSSTDPFIKFKDGSASFNTSTKKYSLFLPNF